MAEQAYVTVPSGSFCRSNQSSLAHLAGSALIGSPTHLVAVKNTPIRASP
jgi:hypothetical protein